MITNKELSIYLIYVIGAILILFKITKLYFWYVFEKEQLSGKIRINVAFLMQLAQNLVQNMSILYIISISV